jgi:transglutaminase-like putative cysteine protease
MFAMLTLPPTECEASEDMGFYIKSTVTFVNEGSEMWNLTLQDHSWSLFMNNSWQTVRLIGHAHPSETVTEDVDSNKLAVFQFESSLPPSERISDYVVYHVRSKPRSIPNLTYAESGTLAEIPEDLQERYCNGHGFWLTNETRIREKALSITGNETRVLTIVAKLVSWIWNNINYRSHDPPLYPNETLSLREGDCDEQAILFGTFCRALGIPSYIQVGCIFMPEMNSSSNVGHLHIIQKQISWHGWTVVYVPAWGWLPVDLTYVMGSHADPLNAIKKGAVTLQYTIQSMNVSENDYLASDRAYLDLLERNNFSLYTEDEMMETSPLLGDLNGDRIVNITDIAVAAKAFGSKPNSKNWNITADINRDEIVNIIDISIIAREYGKTD